MKTAGRTSPQVVTAIARVEGRRLLRHPAFLAGVGFVLIGSWAFVRAGLTRSPVSWGDDGWTVAAGFILLAILTMTAANLTALRDRREHTQEQLETLPVDAPTRVGGLLTALLWPASLAAAMLATVVVYEVSRGTLTRGVELAQLIGYLWTVLTLGALGIAIAAWLPNPFVVPLLGWALLLAHPGEHPESWHSLGPFVGLRTAELAGWHLTYLVGLTGIFAIVALARSSRLRTLLAPGIVAIGTMVISAAIVVSRACPVHGRCLF
jgi:hypothetical protein